MSNLARANSISPPQVRASATGYGYGHGGYGNGGHGHGGYENGGHGHGGYGNGGHGHGGYVQCLFDSRNHKLQADLSRIIWFFLLRIFGFCLIQTNRNIDFVLPPRGSKQCLEMQNNQREGDVCARPRVTKVSGAKSCGSATFLLGTNPLVNTRQVTGPSAAVKGMPV